MYTYDAKTERCEAFEACEKTSAVSCPNCVSGHRDCASAPWAMVVGGYRQGSIKTTELISLDPEAHPVPDCMKTLKSYPYPVTSASGGVVRGMQIN